MLQRMVDRVRWWLFHAPGTAERSHLPHYPHEFDAPSDILRQLRYVDPTADLLYLGWGQWQLVSVRPDRAKMDVGARRLEASSLQLRRWDADFSMSRAPGIFRRLWRRRLYWTAVSQGARPITKYHFAFVRRFGLEAIVADFRRMDWMHRTATENAVFDENNALYGLDFEKARARRDADLELRDESKALHVWDFLDKNPHSVTREASPDTRRHRSGFTTVATIGADGTRARTG